MNGGTGYLVENGFNANPYLFVYNNPLTYQDENGEFASLALNIGRSIIAGAGIGALWDYTEQVVNNFFNGKNGTEALTDIDKGEVAKSAIIGGATLGVGNTAVKGIKAIRSARRVNKAVKHAADYLGEGVSIKTNPHKDKVFMSQDKLRKIRFDINNKHQGSKGPHAHIQYLKGIKKAKWLDIGPHQIYPKGK